MDDDTVLTFFGKAGEFIPNEPKKDVCWNYANCKEIIIKDKKKGYRQCSICKGYVCPRCGNCHCTNPNLKGEVRLEKNREKAREKLRNPFSLPDDETKELHEDFERVFRLKFNRFRFDSWVDSEIEELLEDFECVYGSYAKMKFRELCEELGCNVSEEIQTRIRRKSERFGFTETPRMVTEDEFPFFIGIEEDEIELPFPDVEIPNLPKNESEGFSFADIEDWQRKLKKK